VTTPCGSRAEGFWNDTGVSSHTNRSVHPHQRAKLKATDVSDGTTCQHGRVFTRSPVLRNPAKRDLVANVQENYLPLLTGTCENGNERWTFGTAAFISMARSQGPFAASGKKEKQDKKLDILVGKMVICFKQELFSIHHKAGKS
jgi:hypothetical protein